jgi:hypothetical protein
MKSENKGQGRLKSAYPMMLVYEMRNKIAVLNTIFLTSPDTGPENKLFENEYFLALSHYKLPLIS